MLDWKPGETKYYQQAGAYKIAACKVRGKWTYICYFRKESIDVKYSVEEARIVCNAHKKKWDEQWNNR